MIQKEDIKRYIDISIDPSTTKSQYAADFTEVHVPDLAQVDMDFLTSHEGSLEGVVDVGFMDEIRPSVMEKGHFILFMGLARSCHWLTEQNLEAFMLEVIDSPYATPKALQGLFKRIPESMYPSVRIWLDNLLRSESPKSVIYPHLFAHIQNTKSTQVAAIHEVLTLNFRFIEDRTEEACRF